MVKKQSPTRVMIASSEQNADLFYQTRFLVPDPVIYYEIRGQKTLILSDLEIDRAKKQAKVDRIFSMRDFIKKARQLRKKDKTLPIDSAVLAVALKKERIKRIEVSPDFPSIHFVALTKLGFNLKVGPTPFYQERYIKTDVEKKAIQKVLRAQVQVLKEVIEILSKSKIKKNRIYYGKELITSEYLRSYINTYLMSQDCVAKDTIVASGEQASLPHHHGAGPILPHTPIIIDIFPRHLKTLYWGDMTRTLLKGKASPEHKKLYQTVNASNTLARKMVKPGVKVRKIHQAVVDFFKEKGYQTGLIDGRMQGFIHSTGHGVGLEIHELPSVSINDYVLKPGNVITIEPGLYYQKLGGVRVEDIMFVTKDGAQCLTNAPRIFEIE